MSAARILRPAQAQAYIGIGKGLFAELYAPRLIRIQLGKRAIGYDRNDIDALIDQIKAEALDSEGNVRPLVSEGEKPWVERQSRGSCSATVFGTSTNKSGADAFAKALAAVSGKTQKRT